MYWLLAMLNFKCLIKLKISSRANARATLLVMNENENNDKVNGKVFLIVKSGLRFMGSLMHSLIKDMSDKRSYK
jgi:hypothetical protein